MALKKWSVKITILCGVQAFCCEKSVKNVVKKLKKSVDLFTKNGKQ